MLEFRKQCFHLLSFPLEIGKSRSTSQFASALPGRLMDVDGEILVLARGALRLLRTRTTTVAVADVDTLLDLYERQHICLADECVLEANHLKSVLGFSCTYVH